MKIMESEIEVPYFKQYYPSVEMLDSDQRHFFEYWVKQFKNGTPRTAHASYIFIYIYHLCSKYWESPKERTSTLSELRLINELYNDQVGIHVSSWLSDIYFLEGKYEDAFQVRQKYKAEFRTDNYLLNLKLLTGRDISPQDVISIAKRYGFYPTALFKRRSDEANLLIDEALMEEKKNGNLLRKVSRIPYLVKTTEYLFNGLPREYRTADLIDFFSHSFLIEKCLAYAQEANDRVQNTYARKKSPSKSVKQNVGLSKILWEVKIKEAFDNPNAVLSTEEKCGHPYLRLRNHWETYRKYDCTLCKVTFMCECDREIAIKMRPYQTQGVWLAGICPKCRGLDDTSIVTEGKLMYGSTFKAIHWREIMIEADWLAYRNNDEIDFARAENNIREKYGVPLIGEGWISETTLFKNLQSIFPEYKVIHHGKPEWLGRMHLDVYIPDLGIAFEYQGKQHSQPVEYFGGSESFVQVQKRDKEKLELCISNGIKLFYIYEGEDFSINTLKLILADYF